MKNKKNSTELKKFKVQKTKNGEATKTKKNKIPYLFLVMDEQ